MSKRLFSSPLRHRPSVQMSEDPTHNARSSEEHDDWHKNNPSDDESGVATEGSSPTTGSIGREAVTFAKEKQRDNQEEISEEDRQKIIDYETKHIEELDKKKKEGSLDELLAL